jgi:hypothetical protein
MSVVYECHNPQCTLGSRSEPGRFAGGITATQAFMLTGDPEVEKPENEGKTWGEGVCPNCGVSGKATDEAHDEVVDGDDS